MRRATPPAECAQRSARGQRPHPGVGSARFPQSQDISSWGPFDRYRAHSALGYARIKGLRTSGVAWVEGGRPKNSGESGGSNQSIHRGAACVGWVVETCTDRMGRWVNRRQRRGETKSAGPAAELEVESSCVREDGDSADRAVNGAPISESGRLLGVFAQLQISRDRRRV